MQSVGMFIFNHLKLEMVTIKDGKSIKVTLMWIFSSWPSQPMHLLFYSRQREPEQQGSFLSPFLFLFLLPAQKNVFLVMVLVKSSRKVSA